MITHWVSITVRPPYPISTPLGNCQNQEFVIIIIEFVNPVNSILIIFQSLHNRNLKQFPQKLTAIRLIANEPKAAALKHLIQNLITKTKTSSSFQGSHLTSPSADLYYKRRPEQVFQQSSCVSCSSRHSEWLRHLDNTPETSDRAFKSQKHRGSVRDKTVFFFPEVKHLSNILGWGTKITAEKSVMAPNKHKANQAKCNRNQEAQVRFLMKLVRSVRFFLRMNKTMVEGMWYTVLRKSLQHLILL